MPKRPRSIYQPLIELITSSSLLILTTFPAQLDIKIKIMKVLYKKGLYAGEKHYSLTPTHKHINQIQLINLWWKNIKGYFWKPTISIQESILQKLCRKNVCSFTHQPLELLVWFYLMIWETSIKIRFSTKKQDDPDYKLRNDSLLNEGTFVKPSSILSLLKKCHAYWSTGFHFNPLIRRPYFTQTWEDY